MANMLTEWELWAVANRMVEEHGEDAAVQAAFKADACFDRGQLDGYQNWLSIIRRIEKLQSPPTGMLN